MEIIQQPPGATDALAIRDIFEGDVRSRIHQKLGETCLFDSLQAETKRWQGDGEVVVFNAGVFDIMHSNHLLWLTHCRALGAYEYLARQGVDSPSQEQLHAVTASNAVRLVVSVDTDARVARDKGFQAAKGGSPKPLVSWENRVLLLGRQQVTNPQGTARPLIDMITRHGEGADDCGRPTCPHLDNTSITIQLEPDIVIANAASPQTLAVLTETSAAPNTKLITLDEHATAAYDDVLLGGTLKSSSIIQRAKRTDG